MFFKNKLLSIFEVHHLMSYIKTVQWPLKWSRLAHLFFLSKEYIWTSHQNTNEFDFKCISEVLFFDIVQCLHFLKKFYLKGRFYREWIQQEWTKGQLCWTLLAVKNNRQEMGKTLWPKVYAHKSWSLIADLPMMGTEEPGLCPERGQPCPALRFGLCPSLSCFLLSCLGHRGNSSPHTHWPSIFPSCMGRFRPFCQEVSGGKCGQVQVKCFKIAPNTGWKSTYRLSPWFLNSFKQGTRSWPGVEISLPLLFPESVCHGVNVICSAVNSLFWVPCEHSEGHFGLNASVFFKEQWAKADFGS